MKDALRFARRWTGWHGFANDRGTVQAIKRLAKLDLVEINEFHQFRAVQS